jgi:hypothetical protein
MSDNVPAGLLKAQTRSSAADENRKRPEFARMNVPLAKESSAGRGNRLPLAAAALIVLIAILGSGVLAARWWRGKNVLFSAGPPAATNANVATVAAPSPTVSPSPSPTPKPLRKPEPTKKEKPSKLKSIWNKAKGIFR